MMPQAASDADPATAVVRHRAVPVVTFTARIASDYLVVEAAVAEDWHTYAMDNVERAREKTGKDKPDCELPTRFAVDGPVELTGEWRQSQPVDLSDPDIFWYTWGFETRATFAAPVEITGKGDVTITINGQACNATSCSMIQDVKLTVEPADGADSAFDYTSLSLLVGTTQN